MTGGIQTVRYFIPQAGQLRAAEALFCLAQESLSVYTCRCRSSFMPIQCGLLQQGDAKRCDELAEMPKFGL